MSIVKRPGRYGSPAVQTDQATTDILASVNLRRKRIWKKWDWAFSLEPLSFSITANSNGPFTVTSANNPALAVDRITDLYPVDTTVTPNVSGRPLLQTTRQDFYANVAAGTQVPGDPYKYINAGRNSSGLWQIYLGPQASAATTLKGWAKKILSTFTQSDVIANTAFDYFPDGVIEDVLLDGVLSDVARIQGNDVEAARLDISFEHKLKQMVQEQNNVGKDDSPQASSPPQWYMDKKRARRGSTVV